jgi:hypothetical protein
LTLEFVDRHRPAEQIAMGKIHPERSQDAVLRSA